jgi:hypothetical protein
MKTTLRFRDVLKTSVLSSRFDCIVDEAANDWLRQLGKNDLKHSQSVERILDSLVLDSIKTDLSVFDPGEIFLLLVAVYLHDIGRRSPTLQHELEAYTEIRKFPAQFQLRNKFEAEAIAQICAAHASEDLWPISKCDANYGIADLSMTGRPFNLRRLGALLRIADEVDNTYVRIKGIPDESGSVRHIIRFINPIPQKGLIEIQADPETWEDWEDLTKIKDYCQTRLREVGKYLEDTGIYYYQVWLNPDKFHIPFKVPRHTQSLDDLVETIASLAAENYAKVEILKNIEDFEISVLCTDKKFGTTTVTAILVYNSLTLGEAKSAKAALSYLHDKKYIHTWIVLTVNPPPEETLQVLFAQGCAVLTLDGLVRNLYDFESPLRRLIESYEAEPIFTDNLFTNLRASKESTQSVDNVTDYINEWVHQDPGVHLTLLGDFGSGKTTISEKLAHDLAQQYLAGSFGRIPVLLKLKEVSVANSIEAAITDLFVNQMRIDINFKTFEVLNKMGKFVLIMDGFDEMVAGSQSPEASIVKSFRELDKLVEQNGKVILTCRTHFFKEDADIHTLLGGSVLYEAIRDKYGYELLFLEPFTEQQINQYLDKWAPQDSIRYKEVIREVYNLSDLATRPVLLNMIAKTIPQLDASIMSTINAASLYSLYTRFWLERDDWRSELTIHERKRLAQALSTHFFCTGTFYIHYGELPSLGEKIFGGKLLVSPEALDYELRTCNFLRRDHRGIYSFVHKSFMEFFLATILAEQFLDSTSDISVEWLLPIEVTLIKVSDYPVASIETYEFFLQLCGAPLREMSFDTLYALAGKRQRAHDIIARAILRMQCKHDGLFFARSLLDNGCSVQISVLAAGLKESFDVREALGWMCDEIKRGVPGGLNAERVSVVYDSLTDVFGKKEHGILDSLRDAVKAFEAEKDTFEVTSAEEDKPYPFTRIEKRKRLEAVVGGIDNVEELASARKAFYRQWSRDKAVFDQSIENARRNRRKLEDRIHNEELRKEKRRREH